MTAPAAADVEWFKRTGHCGHCGQPGTFCLCSPRAPCGCRDLHPMGSGLAPDALNSFIDVDDEHDQDGLW